MKFVIYNSENDTYLQVHLSIFVEVESPNDATIFHNFDELERANISTDSFFQPKFSFLPVTVDVVPDAMNPISANKLKKKKTQTPPIASIPGSSFEHNYKDYAINEHKLKDFLKKNLS